MKTCIVLLPLLFSLNVCSKNLEFKWDNKVKVKFSEKLFRSGRLQVNGVEIGSVDKTLYNAWREYERTYRGYSFYELLDAVYGKKWRKAHKMTFIAFDGYLQTVKIEEMLEAADEKKAYLAYSETGKKGFSQFKRGKKVIDPGPFYLLWSQFREGDKPKDKDALKWPYQLKIVNIISEEK